MASAMGAAHPVGHTVQVGPLEWDAHEVTIGQVKAFANATGFVSQAERAGGGTVFESGWTHKPGWTWRLPFGVAARDDEPAVHLDFDEAHARLQQTCQRLGITWLEREVLQLGGVRFVGTTDGGLTKMPNPPRAGGDLHDIWWDPSDADRYVVGDDGGVGITIDGGKSFTRIALPNAQMYHVATDTKIPYNLYGNRQDGYSYGGPSNSRGSRSIGVWSAVGGCESGWAVPDTIDQRTVWSGCYDAGLERFDLQTKMARAVEPWPEAGYGVAPKDLKYRFQWTFPITISPHDHNTVYVGSQFVHKTTNGGQSWTLISPDLSTNDSTKQQSSGGVVIDNLFVENVTVLFAIAESPLVKDLIWAGTMDGLLHITRDGGKSWTNVTANMPGLPKWSTMSAIEPSKYDAGTAYVAVDAHLINDRDPYIYKTTDFGKTWTKLGSDIPKSVFSYVHVVREDPVRKGMLYAGTENGLYVSLDDGAHFTEINGSLPHAPVSWLQIQGHFHDLVVATYGRGFWIADDISYLRSLSDSLLTKRAALLPLRAAYRFRKIATPTGPTNSLVGGEDPPLAATINFAISEMPKDSTARDSVRFRVYDASGATIRTFASAPPQRGLNRALWDLRHNGPRKAKLRACAGLASARTVGPRSRWRSGRAAGGAGHVRRCHDLGARHAAAIVGGTA